MNAQLSGGQNQVNEANGNNVNGIVQQIAQENNYLGLNPDEIRLDFNQGELPM